MSGATKQDWELARESVLTVYSDAKAQKVSRNSARTPCVITKWALWSQSAQSFLASEAKETVEAAWLDAASRLPPVPAPVEPESAEPQVYELRPKLQTVRAIQWTGSNLADVRKVYSGLGEEYMRDKGCTMGDFVIFPRPGQVYFMKPERFHETYVAVAEKKREAMPERPEMSDSPQTQPSGNLKHIRKCHAYMDALEAKVAALEADGWVSAEERLPPKGETVMLWCCDTLGHYSKIMRCEMEETYFDTSGEMLVNGVTHWHPLPSPPTADKPGAEVKDA